MTLSTRNLTLQRGHRLLLQDFDLTLNAGDGISLRGANGSGKTTLLRALAGLHEPKAGKVCGNDPDDGPDGSLCQISFLGHQDPIKAGEKLADQLAFWAILAGGSSASPLSGKLPAQQTEGVSPITSTPGSRPLQFLRGSFSTSGEAARISLITTQLGLTRQLGLQGGVLSAGQRRRASLARLLIEDRPIWLLDEPAAPLDSEGRALLGQVLDGHRAKGGMFVAAVHDELPGGATRTIWLDKP